MVTISGQFGDENAKKIRQKNNEYIYTLMLSRKTKTTPSYVGERFFNSFVNISLVILELWSNNFTSNYYLQDLIIFISLNNCTSRTIIEPCPSLSCKF